jgi:hypothetical protein
MKDLRTGEITPPPSHQEYRESQRRLAEEEQARRDRATAAPAEAVRPAATAVAAPPAPAAPADAGRVQVATEPGPKVDRPKVAGR